MLRALVLEEEFARAQQTSHEFESIQTWWSFRENVTEDSSTAIAFLDLFAGDEPNWIFPKFSGVIFVKNVKFYGILIDESHE